MAKLFVAIIIASLMAAATAQAPIEAAKLKAILETLQLEIESYNPDYVSSTVKTSSVNGDNPNSFLVTLNVKNTQGTETWAAVVDFTENQEYVVQSLERDGVAVDLGPAEEPLVVDFGNFEYAEDAGDSLQAGPADPNAVGNYPPTPEGNIEGRPAEPAAETTEASPAEPTAETTEASPAEPTAETSTTTPTEAPTEAPQNSASPIASSMLASVAVIIAAAMI